MLPSASLLHLTNKHLILVKKKKKINSRETLKSEIFLGTLEGAQLGVPGRREPGRKL